MRCDVAHLVEPSTRTLGEDRLAVVRCASSTVLVVADGAGGTAHGALAADELVSRVRDAVVGDEDVDLIGVLTSADRLLRQGQTTAVIARICASGIMGASVGDSEGCFIDDGDTQVLTARQHRKPLLGSRHAVPVAFFAPIRAGMLIVGTDGLFKYASRASIEDLVRRVPLAECPSRLIDLVRLRSGRLPDDVAVIVARCSTRRKISSPPAVSPTKGGPPCLRTFT